VSAPLVTAVAPSGFASISARVADIDARAREADGHPSVNDTVWRDLRDPGPDSAGFFAGDDAYAHLARTDNQATHWELALAIAPTARATGVAAALVDSGLQHARAHRGGTVVVWVLGADDDTDAQLRTAGFQVARELYEMHVSLPLPGRAELPAGVAVRTFRPGEDDDAWLEVNNRAFEHHAEQGGWTRTTLRRREQEPWFDPSLFLLAFDAHGLAGFNWLKVHPATDDQPALGEIFVIGTDPRTQGSGLGRALALAGFDALVARGITTGMLFCAADNAPALKLYRSLGFTVYRTDRAYECEVTA
jgi:mycothiol synthase